MKIKRGEIWWADLEPVKGSEQGGIRPVLIIQNNISNQRSPTTIISPITSKRESRTFITNLPLPTHYSGLKKDSIILCNQIRTIDKQRLIKKASSLPQEVMRKVDRALKISLDLE